jgi:hypothetical protein
VLWDEELAPGEVDWSGVDELCGELACANATAPLTAIAKRIFERCFLIVSLHLGLKTLVCFALTSFKGVKLACPITMTESRAQQVLALFVSDAD